MTPSIQLFVTNLFAAWNSHDVEQTAKFYADQYIGIDVAQATPHEGKAGIRAFFELYRTAIPDFFFSIDEVIAEGNRVAVFWNVRGTHQGTLMNIPPTGSLISTRGVSLFTIESNEVQRATYIWDLAGLLRNIGLLPELA